jgi:hypothetical protein
MPAECVAILQTGVVDKFYPTRVSVSCSLPRESLNPTSRRVPSLPFPWCTVHGGKLWRGVPLLCKSKNVELKAFSERHDSAFFHWEPANPLSMVSPKMEVTVTSKLPPHYVPVLSNWASLTPCLGFPHFPPTE